MKLRSRVFISYAKEDFKFAKRLYDELTNYGAIPWIDNENLLPGQRWKPVIEDSIRSSQYFIAILSNNSVSKTGYVQKELKIALEYLDEIPETEIFLIPIRIDSCPIINRKLLDIHYVDMFPEWEIGLNKILQAMKINSDFIAQKINVSKSSYEKKYTSTIVDTKKKTIEECLNELNDFVGLESFKNEINKIIQSTMLKKEMIENGLDVPDMSYHFALTGNPGTGKTSGARILAQIFYALGIISKGHIVEVSREDLVSGYVGQTTIKTQEKLDRAKGGVFFIDEAYRLASSENDFGIEALHTIMGNMTKDDFDSIIIMAGYQYEMNRFLEANPGIKARFRKIHLEDFTPEEMLLLFEKACIKRKYKLDDEARKMISKKFQELYDNLSEYFGNAREVRSIFEKTVINHSERLSKNENVTSDDLKTLTIDDLPI